LIFIDNKTLSGSSNPERPYQ